MASRVLLNLVKRSVNFARSSKLNDCLYRSSVFTTRNLSASSILNADRKFTEKHEWVSMDGITGTVGISQHAQDALGDIVFVQLPELGAEYTKDDECGALESVKAASEIYCPVSGKITHVNSAVADKPELVNKDCYKDGWLFKIQLANEAELEELMSEAQYNEYLENQD